MLSPAISKNIELGDSNKGEEFYNLFNSCWDILSDYEQEIPFDDLVEYLMHSLTYDKQKLSQLVNNKIFLENFLGPYSIYRKPFRTNPKR